MHYVVFFSAQKGSSFLQYLNNSINTRMNNHYPKFVTFRQSRQHLVFTTALDLDIWIIYCCKYGNSKFHGLLDIDGTWLACTDLEICKNHLLSEIIEAIVPPDMEEIPLMGSMKTSSLSLTFNLPVVNKQCGVYRNWP